MGFNKKHSEETKKKISKTLTGRIPWNKGKKTGIVPSNVFKKGHKNYLLNHSEETKKKISETLAGRVPWNKGIKTGLVTESVFKKGYKPWNKGFGDRAEKSRMRALSEYKEWRKEALLRDGHTCQLCGASGSSVALHVDHYPISFSELVQINNVTSVEEAIKCPAMWNLDNARTLCRKCHYKVTFNKESVSDSWCKVQVKYKC